MLFNFPRNLLFLQAGTNKLVEDTATGNPLTFLTNVAKPLRSLSLPLLPRQSGTGDPSPDNVRPITGWNGLTAWAAGKNLLQNKINAISPTSVMIGQDEAYATAQKTFLKAGTYTLSYDISANAYVYYRNTDNSVNGRSKAATDRAFTFTLLSDDWFAFWFYSGNGITEQDVKRFQLEVGEQASEYSPYTEQSYPVVFPAMGKNLLKVTAESATKYTVDFTVNSNGSVTADGTATNGTAQLLLSRFYPVEGETYKFNGISGGGSSTYRIAIVFYAEGGSYISEKAFYDGDNSFTFPPSAQYADVYFRVANGVTVNDVTILPMIRLASVADATFEPYTNTVYGGTLDLVSGVLTVEWAKKTLNGTEPWARYSNTSNNNYRFRTDSLADRLDGDGVNGTQKCDYLAPTTGDITGGGSAIITGTANSITFVSSNKRLYVYVPDILSAEDDLDGWKAYLAEHPLTVVYKLAAPITYQLTPQQITALVGDNTIWSDTNGENTVVYLKKA